MVYEDGVGLDGFYDIDKGNKVTLVRRMETSPIKYSVMRSKSPRFRERVEESVPVGTYTIDCLMKKSFASSVRDNNYRYAAAFNSQVHRFARPQTSTASCPFYEAISDNSMRPNTLARSVETTPIKYSILSSTDRSHDVGEFFTKTEGPDTFYNLDHGSKVTLYTSMQKSPNKFSIMRTSAPKWPVRKADAYPHLGPGSYNSVAARDIKTAPCLESRPLSSLASTRPRFKDPKPIEGRPVDTRYKPKPQDEQWRPRKKVNDEHKLRAEVQRLSRQKTLDLLHAQNSMKAAGFSMRASSMNDSFG